MATASISGLSSGLDTATIVSQLMQLEKIPQNKLKSSLSTEQAKLTSLQSLNARVAELTAQAKALAAGTGLGALSVSSSSSAVSVTSSSGAAGGSFSFTVNQTAAAHRLSYAATAAAGDVVVSGGTTVELTISGSPQTLETGDGTLDGLVKALNGSGTGVSAAKIRLDDGSHRLLVTATATGASGAFTLTNADGSDLLGGASVTSGRDASITLGTDTIHSSSNTFTGVLPGADVTVSTAAVGTDVEVTVARDLTSIKAAAKSLVDAVNETLTQIDSLTAAGSTRPGQLAGDSTLRRLRNELVTSIYPAGGGTMADLGLQTDRTGKLVLDQDVFATAYAADPAAVTARFGTADGFAARIQNVAAGASDKYTGSLTTSITGRSSNISRLEDSIEAWDLRLELRRSTLQQRFTALETALSQMNSQSSWLSGQINSLSGSSGS